MKPPESIVDICKLLEDKKAENIVICDASKKTNAANWFILCSTLNYTQTNAIAGYLVQKNDEKKLFDFANREGFIPSNWVVVDFGELMVHIFTKDEREHYNLDKILDEGSNFISFSKLKKKFLKGSK